MYGTAAFHSSKIIGFISKFFTEILACSGCFQWSDDLQDERGQGPGQT